LSSPFPLLSVGVLSLEEAEAAATTAPGAGHGNTSRQVSSRCTTGQRICLPDGFPAIGLTAAVGFTAAFVDKIAAGTIVLLGTDTPPLPPSLLLMLPKGTSRAYSHNDEIPSVAGGAVPLSYHKPRSRVKVSA